MTCSCSVGYDAKQKKARKEKQQKLEEEIKKLTKEIEEIKTNALYKNAFEWRFEFPEVLNNLGEFEGFDLIIGNPPYISYYSRQSAELNDSFRQYYVQNYKIVDNPRARFNSLQLFIERSLAIAKKCAYVNLIVDKTILAEKNSITLRKYLLNNYTLIEIVPNLKNVFGAVVDPLIINIANEFKEEYKINAVLSEELEHPLKFLNLDINSIKENKGYEIKIDLHQSPIDFKRVFKLSVPLNQVAILKSGANIGGHEKEFIFDKKLSELHKPVLRGSKNIQKYFLDSNNHKYILYDHSLQYSINEKEELKKGGEKVNLVKLGDGHIDNRYDKPKIIIRQSSSEFTATYDEKGFYCLYGLFILNQLNNKVSLKYLLALLNSRLYTYYGLVSQTIITGHKKQPQIRAKGIKELPIKIISELEQNPFNDLVDKIISLKQQGKDSSEQEKKIDELVYKLYDITPDEQKIIKGQ